MCLRILQPLPCYAKVVHRPQNVIDPTMLVAHDRAYMHMIATGIPHATIYISTVILSSKAYVYMPYRPEAPLWYYIYLKKKIYIYIYIMTYIHIMYYDIINE